MIKNATLVSHPCFNPTTAKECGRVHLPVAPRCNIQCNFCSRRFDCVNESRPGVTSTLLSPHQALSYLTEVMALDESIKVVGIAGPGDPLANLDATFNTLELVRDRYPELLLCIATNGLGLPDAVDRLHKLGKAHVTVTVNAVDADIGSQIYSWVRDKNVIYRGTDAARFLLERQLWGISDLVERSIPVKVNFITIPGVNDNHVGDVAAIMAELGVDLMNCVPLKPVAGTPLENLSEPDADTMWKVRRFAERYLPQMHHCTRCRADAVGLLGIEPSAEVKEALREAGAKPLRPDANRPNVALASREGMLVNQHLGEAESLLIYTPRDGSYAYLESRLTPKHGTSRRWQELGTVVSDCHTLLVSGIGETPRQELVMQGLRVIETTEMVTEVLTSLYNGKSVRNIPRQVFKCGASCKGAGDGCG